MKKVVVVALSLVAFLCLLPIAFRLYVTLSRPHEKANSEIVMDLQTDRQKAEKEILAKLTARVGDGNGARYYLMACAALVNPPGESPLWKSIDRVIDSGWRKDDPDLEAFMKQNEPALDLVVKGTKQRSCLITVENMTDDLAYLHGLRQIGRLFVVRAEYLEKKQQYEAEEKLYADFLRFAADVTGMGTIIHELVGIAITQLAYHSMDSFVSALDDDTLCSDLLGQMIEMEWKRMSLHPLLEREFAYSRNLYQSLGKEYLYVGNSPEKSGTIKRFVNSTLSGFGYLWFHVRKPAMLKRMDNAHQIILEESKKPYPDILRSHFEDEVPKDKLIEVWLPTIRQFIVVMARHDTVRRANILKVALRLHHLRQSDYPETLDQLLPLVSETILTDPLSGKRFVYKKTGGEYLFYSFGLDLDDDGGREVQTSNSQKDGDIVFKSTPSPTS